MNELLLRRELFGGTLYSPMTGKRVYVNQREFAEIEKTWEVPMNLAEGQGLSGHAWIVYPKILPEGNFSFPDTIYFEVTRNCNLRCTQCFNQSGRKLSNELSLNNQLDLIRKLAMAGAQEIRFTGGEPLLSVGILELVRKAANFGLRATVGTNATLISRETAKNLAEAGLKGAVISIDGNASVHDAIRGKGSFEKSLLGIAYLREQGIETRVNTTVMNENFQSIPALAEFFHQQGIKMFIRRLMPAGRAAADWKRRVLNQEQYAWLKDELQELLENPDGLVYGHYLREKKFRPRVKLPFLRSNCTVGQRALVIEPDGKIGLCGFLKQNKFLFDVRTMELDKIWKSISEKDPIEALELEKVLKKHNFQHELQTDCYAIAYGAKQ